MGGIGEPTADNTGKERDGEIGGQRTSYVILTMNALGKIEKHRAGYVFLQPLTRYNLTYV